MQYTPTGMFSALLYEGNSEPSADRVKHVGSCHSSSSSNGLETWLWANTSLIRIQTPAGTDSHTNLQ